MVAEGLQAYCENRAAGRDGAGPRQRGRTDVR